MLYLIHGNLRDKILARSNELEQKFTEANPDALVFRFSVDGFERAKFEELISSRSLFAKKTLVVGDQLFSSAEIAVWLTKLLPEIALSPNTFIFREGDLNKKSLELFQKAGARIEEFSLRQNKGYAGAKEVKLRAGYEGFNIFSLTDALGARDKKQAWVLYQKALRAGFPAEEIFWKAVWIFRNIILASSMNTDQAGLASKLKVSPYTINNSRRMTKNYKPEELIVSYRKLVDIYHSFRRGTAEAEVAMEQLILNL